MRRLIESWLPLREVNGDAGLEVGFRSHELTLVLG